jgi:anti-sigma regulatory factor (Ser/Thr protein kinase)
MQNLLRKVLTGKDATALLTALNELANNAADWGALPVRVTILVEPDRVTATVEDAGGGFDPSAPPLTPDERRAAGKRAGGHGLALVRTKVDSLEHFAGGRIARIVKKSRE